MEIISLILFFGLIILTAYLLAKVEINMEGKHGYAEKLPVTWRAKSKWVRRFITGTSYHWYMGLFLLAIVHLPFIVVPWSLAIELLCLAFLAGLSVAEDFLWFVFNPTIDEETGKRVYGITHYSKKHIPWFEWFWGLPLWYWWYIPIGIALFIGAILL